MYVIFADETDKVTGMNLTAFEFTSVMIFVGFGFLYAFIRRYSWTGIAQNLIIGTFAAEFYLIFRSFWWYLLDSDLEFSDFTLDFNEDSLFLAEFCGGAVLVSFGAVIGKASTFQMVVMAGFEVLFYCLNEYLMTKLEVIDVGGGLTLHMFGCYFGLAASLIFSPHHGRNHTLNSTSYTSNIYALVGTLLLWVSWPCFNSAVTTSYDSYYAILNTVVALFGSTVSVFIVSSMLNGGKLNMVSIVNATLSGAVGVGTIAGNLQYAGWALLLGAICGVVSTLGFELLSAKLEHWIGLQDTAGIHNLHGMPAIIGAIFSIFFFISEENKSQAGNQAIGTLVTLGLSISSGLVFGLFLKFTKHLTNKDFFLDEEHWVDCNSGENNNLNTELIGKPINSDQ